MLGNASKKIAVRIGLCVYPCRYRERLIMCARSLSARKKQIVVLANYMYVCRFHNCTGPVAPRDPLPHPQVHHFLCVCTCARWFLELRNVSYILRNLSFKPYVYDRLRSAPPVRSACRRKDIISSSRSGACIQIMYDLRVGLKAPNISRHVNCSSFERKRGGGSFTHVMV